MNATTGVGNALMGNSGGAVRDVNKAEDQFTGAVAMNSTTASFNNMAAQRYKATVNTKDIFCTLTAIEVDGSPKRSGMVKVNKDSGVELGKILLKELTPIYIQDDVDGVMYVIVDDNNFYCYKL